MIRLAEHSDLNDIVSIHAFSGNRAEEIAENRLYVFCAENVVSGFLVKSKKGLLDRPYVEYLAVKGSARRQGIATALLKHFENLFPNNRVFISTEANNSKMIELLAAEGYVQSGQISAAHLSGQNELYFYKDTN